MSKWRDPEKWESLLTEAGCPICQRGTPADALAQLEVSWVDLPEDAPMRGYACLTSRRHVIELHDFTDDEAVAFMRDVRRVARAVASAVHPVKLNVELHGNTVPHLHLHLFPRYRGGSIRGEADRPARREARGLRTGRAREPARGRRASARGACGTAALTRKPLWSMRCTDSILTIDTFAGGLGAGLSTGSDACDDLRSGCASAPCSCRLQRC